MRSRDAGLTHDRLWAAIDAIAATTGSSTSALARRAGLNPSALNRSKRFTPDGRPRWPSTESLAKILEATGFDLVDLAQMIVDPVCLRSPHGAARWAMSEVGLAGGFAEAPGQTAAIPPGAAAGEFFAFAVERAVQPYQPGDVLIASTGVAPRRGDRVLVRGIDGRIAVRTFLARTDRSLTFAAEAAGARPLRLPAADVVWMARILWASQ